MVKLHFEVRILLIVRVFCTMEMDLSVQSQIHSGVVKYVRCSTSTSFRGAW